jgi:MinD superfamily P-loop ATPase
LEKKIIGIISGKGGVGKTSLTASLVSLANKDSEITAMAMDCDVDAPNLALIMPSKSNESIESKDCYTSLKATFLENKCVHCKLCIEDHFCEFNALSWDDEKEVPEINYLSCEGCQACKVLCPEDAFEISPVKSGEIRSYITKGNVPLIYGKTRLGSTTSGKLVSECKTFAQNHERFEESNLLIIDGPPGIGCPVIATVSGLDYIITICEPTPSGLHDLKRAIEVVKSFEIPFGIVVNKYDLKSPFQTKFENYIEKSGHNILGKIPFDLTIPKAMSFAEAIVDFKSDSKASKAIKEIYKNLRRNLWNSQISSH